jgi:hypothetical protein
MLSSFTGAKTQDGTDLGQRMLNTVATQSIRHLFTESRLVDVAVRCHPSSKLLQGSIDNFKMTGQGLVIRRDFRVEEMAFETDAVAIDAGALLSGKLRLKQPTQAIAQVVLTEDAINQAFEAELVKRRLQNVTLESLTNLSGGEPVSFADVRLQLLADNQVKISAKTDLPNQSNVPIRLMATLSVEKRRRISFKDPQFISDDVPESLRGLSEVITNAFAQILDNMVDLDRFDLDGVIMRINRLETHGKTLVFSGYAQIEHFPRGK